MVYCLKSVHKNQKALPTTISSVSSDSSTALISLLSCRDCCESLKNGCAIACSAVIRLEGRYASILESRSMKFFLSSTIWKTSTKFLRLLLGKESKSLESKTTFDWNSLTSVGLKEPMVSKILNNWSPSVLPLKKGVCRNSSARMHPAAHISIATVYYVMQRISSGAR